MSFELLNEFMVDLRTLRSIRVDAQITSPEDELSLINDSKFKNGFAVAASLLGTGIFFTDFGSEDKKSRPAGMVREVRQ